MSSETVSAVPTARIARLSVALLLTINMFNYVDRQVLAATLTPIKKELFLPNDETADFWMGMLFTAFLVSYMCAAPVFGWLADRRSRWKLIGAAVVVWSLASGASGLAPAFGSWRFVSTFTALLITRLFVGIGEAAYGPAAPTVISDLFPIQRRGSVLAWFYMAIPVGSAVGYIWGGLIAQLLDWRWAFYLVVPPGMLLGLLCFLMPEPVRGASETGSNRTARTNPPRQVKLADYLTFVRTPSYVLNTAGMTAMTFAIGGVATWMPTYVHEFRKEPDLGHVNTIFGAITVVSGVSATFLGGLVADRLSARFPGAYFLVSGTAMLLGFPCFLLVLVTPFPWAWVLIFLAEFCLFFNTGPTNTIVANVTHPAIRSSAYALNILVIHLLGDAISPPLIGWLTGVFDGDMNVGFMAVSVTVLLGGLFWLAVARTWSATRNSRRRGFHPDRKRAMDEPKASSSPRADVPVYNCHVLVSPRDAEGWIVARSTTLSDVTARGRSEREALANLVAAFKTAIIRHTAGGGTVPWAAQPLEPQPGDQQRWIAVHL